MNKTRKEKSKIPMAQAGLRLNPTMPLVARGLLKKPPPQPITLPAQDKDTVNRNLKDAIATPGITGMMRQNQNIPGTIGGQLPKLGAIDWTKTILPEPGNKDMATIGAFTGQLSSPEKAAVMNTEPRLGGERGIWNNIIRNKDVDITLGKALAGIKAAKAAKNLKTQGYHLADGGVMPAKKKPTALLKVK